ncbi:hypothetical protein GCM10010302_51880 [Streptomyces polychromogenes]|uniref:Uncharacterized protein n=1 Tax=Streptomyces polychromogenes TaxID=67342 RepID=A0ABP3F624_9ACTN
MIGEPELEGEWAAREPAPAAARTEDAPAAPASGPAGSLRAAPWRWALGGAVVASMVWAGALVVRERHADAGPPVRHRHSEQLCTETPFKAVGTALGSLGVGMPSHGEGPAVDWSYCFAAGSTGEQAFTHEAQVLVELHKKADPATEFGARPEVDPFAASPAVAAEKVSGLGERAQFSGEVQAPRLQVLDGGTVVTYTVRWWTKGSPGAADEVDGDAVKAAMAEDARALLARLRKK